MNYVKIFVGLLALMLMACQTSWNYKENETQMKYDLLPGSSETENSLETILPHTVLANTIVHFLQSEDNGKEKKALMIGYDGARLDATLALTPPAIWGIKNEPDGGLYYAFTGGDPNAWVTKQDTSSAPGWATLLFGTWANKHGFKNNSGFQKSSTISFLAKAQDLGYNAASLSAWGWLNDNILSREKNSNTFFKYNVPSGVKGYHPKDIDIATRTKEAISANEADVIFVQLDAPDGAGHSKGFDPLVQAYNDQIMATDALAQEIINTIKARATYAQEDWLIILTADHGGLGTSHGMHVPECSEVWFAINQKQYLTEIAAFN